nr:CPBP family intramembrane glutamic endopeptidase [uncultured Fluviicola sp.]
MVNGIIHLYQLDEKGTTALIISSAGRLLLVLCFYLAFKKETFFDLKKVLRNSIGVLIGVGLLLFLSLRFSLPYIGIRYSWEHLTAYYTKCFSVGLMEEVLCRWILFGLVVVAYPKRSVLGQIVTTSALFALLHIGNLITGQLDIFSVLNQMIFAFLLGLLFQGLLIRIKNIILVAVLHGLVNFHGMYNSVFKLKDTSIAEENPITDIIQTQIFFGIVCLVLLLILRFTMKKEDTKGLYAL